MTTSYGATQLNTGLENFGLQTFRGITSAAQTSNVIDPTFISAIINDPNTIAFYVNAITYGGYQLGDIVNDIKRREMVKNGDPNASKIKIIDPELKRADYLNTAEGAQSVVSTRQYIPTINLTGNLNPDILKYGVNMPDDAFRILSPIYDINSEEFKNAVNNVKSAYYDLSMQQLQAENEQDKAVADANMENFKKTLETQYGIALSDNATAAWAQIENLGESMSQRGLRGSGMEQETIDNYLRSVRNKDAQNRQAKLSSEETQTASYYKASATPQQIKALIAEDQAKGLSRDQWRATKWGLVPSDDILQKYSIESLKQRFPDQSEQELKAYRDAVLDENGNYRSTLYSKYYSELNKKQAEKKAAASTKVLQESLNKDEQMRRIYDSADPFSSETKSDIKNTEKISETNPKIGNIGGEQTDEQRKATYAAAGISLPGSTSPSTPTPTSPTGEQTDEQRKATYAAAGISLPGTNPQKLDELNKTWSGINERIAKEGITDTTGKVLKTPTQPIGPVNKPSSYSIQSGDTLSKIASKYGTNVSSLAGLNKIKDINKIYAGQTLKLY